MFIIAFTLLHRCHLIGTSLCYNKKGINDFVSNKRDSNFEFVQFVNVCNWRNVSRFRLCTHNVLLCDIIYILPSRYPSNGMSLLSTLWQRDCGTRQRRLRRVAAASSYRRRSFERHNVIFLSEKGTVTGVRSVHLKSRYEKCARLSAELHNAGMCQRVACRSGATRHDTANSFEILCVRNKRQTTSNAGGESERGAPRNFI